MREGEERPLLSFDLDGVLARPPFGRNLTINRDEQRRDDPSQAREMPPPPVGWWDRLLMATYYRLRYAGRGPMPGARGAVEAAASHYRVIVLSGRSWRGRRRTEAWLDRWGILAHLEGVVLNHTGEPSARFKVGIARGLGVRRHVEDDAATAALLANAGVQVDLIDWPGNRELAFPPGVTRRADLAALAENLRSEA